MWHWSLKGWSSESLISLILLYIPDRPTIFGQHTLVELGIFGQFWTYAQEITATTQNFLDFRDVCCQSLKWSQAKCLAQNISDLFYFLLLAFMAFMNDLMCYRAILMRHATSLPSPAASAANAPEVESKAWQSGAWAVVAFELQKSLGTQFWSTPTCCMLLQSIMQDVHKSLHKKPCLSSVSFTASCGTKSLIAVSSFSFEIALPLHRYSPFLQHFMWGKSPNRCHTQWFQHETTGASKLKCFKAFLPASARLQARLYMSEKQRV